MELTTESPDAELDYYVNQTCGWDINGSLIESNDTSCFEKPLTALDLFSALVYTVICLSGLLGNGLVIFVVLRYTKMKTVTNTYILNLAVADVLFLLELPLLVTTMILKGWIFGDVMCKVFYGLTSVNWFTGMFTLTVMSADRFMAVCHPVTSMRYRTPFYSRATCLAVWVLSFLVMLPVIMYARITPSSPISVTCTIVWSSGQIIPPEKAFIWYAFLLGFAIPVALISVFYTLVVVRLKTVGPAKKSREKKRSHRKVTRLVLTVVLVYIICWLPYWVFQVHLTFVDKKNTTRNYWKVSLFQMITILSYTNSMLNPLLYAFFSDNFRKSFLKAFSCTGAADVNSAITVETSVFPRYKQSCKNYTRGNGSEHCNNTPAPGNHALEATSTLVEQDGLKADNNQQENEDGISECTAMV